MNRLYFKQLSLSERASPFPFSSPLPTWVNEHANAATDRCACGTTPRRVFNVGRLHGAGIEMPLRGSAFAFGRLLFAE